MQIDKIVTLASALIKNSGGKYLLLKRSNKSAYAKHWQFVEGKLEEGEHPIDALKREISEEIGANVSELQLNSISHTLANVKSISYLGFRIIFVVKLTSHDIVLSKEHTDFGWFTKDEALKIKLLPGVKEILNREV